MRTFGLFMNNVDERQLVARIQAESIEEAAKKLDCYLVPISETLAALSPRWNLGELVGNKILIMEVQCIQNDGELRKRFRELGYTI